MMKTAHMTASTTGWSRMHAWARREDEAEALAQAEYEDDMGILGRGDDVSTGTEVSAEVGS